VEELLKDILEALQYQNKLLETIVETASLGAAPTDGKAVMEKAVDTVLNMPMFAKLDKAPFKAMMGGGQ